jgi:ABC-type nitrate/sulfonate/bicarbonate transport system ATPase subunit
MLININYLVDGAAFLEAPSLELLDRPFHELDQLNRPELQQRQLTLLVAFRDLKQVEYF